MEGYYLRDFIECLVCTEYTVRSLDVDRQDQYLSSNLLFCFILFLKAAEKRDKNMKTIQGEV
jgi:hypothetical protein